MRDRPLTPKSEEHCLNFIAVLLIRKDALVLKVEGEAPLAVCERSRFGFTGEGDGVGEEDTRRK